VWKAGLSYEGEQGAGGNFQKAVKKTEVVWIFKKRRKEGSISQREKSRVGWHIGKSSGKHSKKGG